MLEKKIKIVTFFIVTMILICNVTNAGAERKKAKNIIFMVADGMGLSHVTATRLFLNGPDGPPLAMEMFPQIGYQRTYSADSFVTDSAAAASAWASGEKFHNGEISCHGNADGSCNNLRPTILEIAKSKGKATGLDRSKAREKKGYPGHRRRRS